MALLATLAKLRSPAVLVAQNGTSMALPNYMVDEVEQSRASIVAAMCSSSSVAGRTRHSYAAGSQPWDSAAAEEDDASSPVEPPEQLVPVCSRPRPSLTGSSKVAPSSPRVQPLPSPGDTPTASFTASGSERPRRVSLGQTSRSHLQPSPFAQAQVSSPSSTFRQHPSAPESSAASHHNAAATATAAATITASGSSQSTETRRPLSASASTQAQAPTGPTAPVGADKDLLAAVRGRTSHQPFEGCDDEDSFDEDEIAHDLEVAQGTLARALEMARGSAAPTRRARQGAGGEAGSADGPERSPRGAQRPSGTSSWPSIKVVSVEITPASSFSSQQTLTPGSVHRPSGETSGGAAAATTPISGRYTTGPGIAGSGAGRSILDRAGRASHAGAEPFPASNPSNSGAAGGRGGVGGRCDDRWSLNSSSTVNTRTISGISASGASNFSASSNPRARVSGAGHGPSPSPVPTSRQAVGGGRVSGRAAGAAEDCVDLEAASPEQSTVGAGRQGIGRFAAAGNTGAAQGAVEPAGGRAVRHSGSGGGGGSLKGLIKLAKRAFQRSTGSGSGGSTGKTGPLDSACKGATINGSAADPAPPPPGAPVGPFFASPPVSPPSPAQPMAVGAATAAATEPAPAYTRNNQPAPRPQWASLAPTAASAEGRQSPRSNGAGPPSPLSPFAAAEQSLYESCTSPNGEPPASPTPRSPVALRPQVSGEGSGGSSGGFGAAAGASAAAEGAFPDRPLPRRFSSLSTPASGLAPSAAGVGVGPCSAAAPGGAGGTGPINSPTQRRRFTNGSSGYSSHPVSELQVAAHVQSYLQHQQQQQQQQQQLSSGKADQGPGSSDQAARVPNPPASPQGAGAGTAAAGAAGTPDGPSSASPTAAALAILPSCTLPRHGSVDFGASQAGAGPSAGPVGGEVSLRDGTAPNPHPAAASADGAATGGWCPVRRSDRHLPHRANAMPSDPFLPGASPSPSPEPPPPPPQPERHRQEELPVRGEDLSGRQAGHVPAGAGACCDAGDDEAEDPSGSRAGLRLHPSALAGITYDGSGGGDGDGPRSSLDGGGRSPAAAGQDHTGGLASEGSTASTGGWQPVASPADRRPARGSDTGSSAPGSPLRPPGYRVGAPRPPPAAPSSGVGAGAGSFTGSGAASRRCSGGGSCSGTAAILSGRRVSGTGDGSGGSGVPSPAGSPMPRRLSASSRRVAPPDAAAAAAAAIATAIVALAEAPLQLSSIDSGPGFAPAPVAPGLPPSPLRPTSAAGGPHSRHNSHAGSPAVPSSPLSY